MYESEVILCLWLTTPNKHTKYVGVNLNLYQTGQGCLNVLNCVDRFHLQNLVFRPETGITFQGFKYCHFEVALYSTLQSIGRRIFRLNLVYQNADSTGICQNFDKYNLLNIFLLWEAKLNCAKQGIKYKCIGGTCD